MTKHEAYEMLSIWSRRSIRDKRLYEAMEIALKALAWECAHENMLGIRIVEEANKNT